MGKVFVFVHESDDAHVWEGDYDIALAPHNALVIQEVGKLSGPVTRAIYNASKWEQVVLNEEDNSNTE